VDVISLFKRTDCCDGQTKWGGNGWGGKY